jgi:hypothetical protein
MKLQGRVESDDGIILKMGGDKIGVDIRPGRFYAPEKNGVEPAPNPQKPAGGQVQSQKIVSGGPTATASLERGHELLVAEHRVDSEEFE